MKTIGSVLEIVVTSILLTWPSLAATLEWSSNDEHDSGITIEQGLTPFAGEQIKRQVVASGGGSASSSTYSVIGTVCQTAVGPMTATSFKLSQGFWHSAGPTSCCVGPRGNVNSAGTVDLGDLSMLIAYLTVTPRPALTCLDAANVNGIGTIDLGDLSLLIAYLTVTPRPTLPSCP